MSWIVDTQTLVRPFPNGCVVAIGVFDGVHRGHQILIREAVQQARMRGLPAVALTFDPHPMRVLSPEQAPSLICSLQHRIERLSAFGIDFTVVQPFDKTFAQLSAEAFIGSIIVRGLGAQGVVVGEDFRFGAERQGDVAFLRQHGGFEVFPISPVLDESGERIASTLVRQWIQSGDLKRVFDALGEPFRWEGIVVRGAQRGRVLGYPTANMVSITPLACPPSGVYACGVWVDGTRYPSAVSVGKPPMFPSNDAVVEAYLIDFPPQPLYGRLLAVEFLKRLREQHTFETVQALQDQMQADVARTKAIFRDFLETTPS